MKTRFKRWLGITAAVVAVLFAALNFIAYHQAYAMTHFVAAGPATEKPEKLSFGQKLNILFFGIDLPRPRTTLLPAKLGPACRSVIIPGTNGVRLGAWYCPVSPDKPLVILFHGYHGEKTGVLKEASVFQELACPYCWLIFVARAILPSLTRPWAMTRATTLPPQFAMQTPISRIPSWSCTAIPWAPRPFYGRPTIAASGLMQLLRKPYLTGC